MAVHHRVQQERSAGMRQTKMNFWDGMEHAFMMSSITAEERTAIWDAVAGYVQEQLLLHKGVRIPTLGSFDTVPKQIQVGCEAVIIQQPVFHLARNLVNVHNLTDNKAYLPGNKEVEALKYAKVAAATCVSRQKAESCIQGTISLLSYCLGKGENIALALRDIGVLLIEGRRVQMKFYYNFMETLSGKENLGKAVFKVPQLLDMVVSPVVPVASLSSSGRVIIFPEFEIEFVPKPLARDLLKTSRQGPGEDKKMRRARWSPFGQGRKVGSPGFPFPVSPDSINTEIPQFWEITGPRKRKKSRVRQRSEIPKSSSAKKQPVTRRPKGKSMLKGQTPKQSQVQALPQSYGEEGIVDQILAEMAARKTVKAKPAHPRGALTFETPVIAILSTTSSEASLL
ncbi:coiled-coil domain-containing protein 81-like isoform X1 [Aquila chrysaetos chrysaetos]|uniref:coiled-coil domain-containing protein 81-like isoform X1 n=2 Tax=Aquila chrysaetos chrysaetos TaxID=223781 RepID=UPI001176570D|nr:coiled-coil domain-containing protein 81-like isoform X1 [Aquila chrysaetos chrysaetos]